MSVGKILILIGLGIALVGKVAHLSWLEGRRSVRGGQAIVVSFGKDGQVIDTKSYEKDGTWDPPPGVASVLVLAWSAENGWRPAQQLRPSAPRMSLGLNGGGAAPFQSPKPEGKK